MEINAPLSVKFFKTESGNEPVRDWLLEDLTIEERKIVGRDIKVIQMSWPIGMPLVKSIPRDFESPGSSKGEECAVTSGRSRYYREPPAPAGGGSTGRRFMGSEV